MAKTTKVLTEKVVVTMINATKNTDGSKTIEDIKQDIAGESFKQALGLALTFLQETISKQWDAPIITVAGVKLDDKQVAKLRYNRVRWEAEGFYLLFTEVLATYALQGTVDEQVKFMRATDRNGTFVNQHKFEAQQVAVQAQTTMTLMKEKIKYFKEDAVDSIYTAADLERKQLAKDKSSAKRLEMKKAKQVLIAEAIS
jgi:hypothetical protein